MHITCAPIQRVKMFASETRHDVFQGNAVPLRRKVLTPLAEEDMSIAAICEQLPVSRTAVTKHLAILPDAGLLKSRKVGRETIYTLQSRKLMEIRDWLTYFDRFWDDRLSSLKEYVEGDGS